MSESEWLNCEVAYALPARQQVVSLRVAAGTTAREALVQSGLLQSFPEIVVESAVLGVFGKLVEPEFCLRDGDRLEVYRPLAEDPRAARRMRVKAARKRR